MDSDRKRRCVFLSRLRNPSSSDLEQMRLVGFEYTKLSYWGDDLIATCGFPYDFKEGIPAEICLHFSVAENSVRFVGRVDNGQPNASKFLWDSKRDESRLLVDDHWSSTFDQFSDGHLYSKAYVTLPNEIGVVEPIVLVHNIHSGGVTWFRPEVPEFESAGGDSPW